MCTLAFFDHLGTLPALHCDGRGSDLETTPMLEAFKGMAVERIILKYVSD